MTRLCETDRRFRDQQTERTVEDVIRELQEPAGQFGKSMILCQEAAELLAVTEACYQRIIEINDQLQDQVAALTALARPETKESLGYAQRLATVLWEKHWKADAPDWKPLPDVLGVLTQIDNLTASLVRDAKVNRDD